MAGLTIFSLFSDFACPSSKYASDPIDITNHELENGHAQDEKENSMRIFMHQNSIAACDRRVRNEVRKTCRESRATMMKWYELEQLKTALSVHKFD